MNAPQRIPWANLSTLRAGVGIVQLLQIQQDEEIFEAIQQSRREGRRLLPVGKGTNLIGSDQELPVTVLSLSAMRAMDVFDGGKVRVQTGIPLGIFVQNLATQGFGGISALAGIPGSLGGALAMNAGANGCSISEFVTEMHGIHLRSGEEWQWRKGDGGWAYRHSPLPPHVMVTTAVLELQPVDSQEEAERISAEWMRRRRVTPRGLSCGSIFRNPPNAPAGRLLEEAGCKGLTEGVFSVSQQHANWIVNASGNVGKAEDCRRLMLRLQSMVMERHGICLEAEWRFADLL